MQMHTILANIGKCILLSNTDTIDKKHNNIIQQSGIEV